MRITDWLDKEEVARKYPIFKGYPVNMKEKGEKAKEQFVVPWEMPHDECNEFKH